MRKLLIGISITSVVGVSASLLSSFGGLFKGGKVSISSISGEATTEAIGAFHKAKQLLDSEEEYFIKGVGSVDAKKAGMNLTTQTIYAVTARKGDSYLIESNSYSGLVKCATRAYSLDEGVRVYHGSNVSKDGSTASWNEKDYKDYSSEQYEEDWGRPITSQFNYVVSEETVLSQELISATNGVFEYLLRLDTEKAVDGYRRQMKTISSLPEKPNFSQVEFRFIVNADGYILSSTTYEIYKTKFGGFSADCVGSITSTYYYGDVAIPSLNEDSKYTGTSKIDSTTSIPSSPIVSEKEYTPLEKIILGFTSEPYSSFNATLQIKNPSLKEIAKLNITLFLDLNDLEKVQVQGNISSSTHGYYFNASFHLDLGENVLYIYSSRVNIKFDIASLQEATDRILGFINQFLDEKISFEMPEINLDELLASLNNSVSEDITNEGEFKWTLQALGSNIEIYGAQDTFAISKIMLPDVNISSYHLSLDCDVLSLDASPIVDRNIDEEKTLDLNTTLNFLDFIQGFISEKRFALNVVASKVNSLGEESYTFECNGQFDLEQNIVQADFDFVDVNGSHLINVGYQDEYAYLSYQDKLKGKLSKQSLQTTFDFVISLLDDEEFINKIGSLITIDASSMDFIGAIKEGNLDTLIPENTISFNIDKENVFVKLDLKPFGIEGNVELVIKPDFSGIDYLNFVICDNEETLTILASLVELKEFSDVDLSSYTDFSSLTRLIPLIKEAVFDYGKYALSGNLKLSIPILGDLNIGLKADIRIGEKFGKADGKVELDVGIKALLTDDKNSSSAPYNPPSGYSVSSIKKRVTTLYIYEDSVIIRRVDNVEYRKNIFTSSKRGTNVAIRKYTFSDFETKYMEIIYFALGVTDTAQGIIDDQIKKATPSEENVDYSQIITAYSFQECELGGIYSIDTNLTALLQNASFSTLNITLQDDGNQLTKLSASTKIASIITVSIDVILQDLSVDVPFGEFDDFVSSYQEGITFTEN